MGVLHITGNLEGVTVRLERIKKIIDHRNEVSYPLFHVSEKWKYFTRPDRGKVCPVCAQYGMDTFNGEELKATFPHAEYVGGGLVRPRTHQPDLSQFMDVECNCEMKLMNALEAFETQLHREKMLAI